jgi:DNA-binding beta-propeller fold protein YncE
MGRIWSDDRDTVAAWRATCACVLAFGLVLVASLLWSAPALAITQRGHVFGSSFGTTGAGDGQLSKPSGVAVNETSGDVYVVDRANNRVEQFSAEGAFIRAWGYGVLDGAKETQVCTSGCKAGLTPGKTGPVTAKGQLALPEGIAIDNSTSSEDPSAGDVYVVADTYPENSFVLKYGPNGEFKGRVNKTGETEEFGRVEGVAVDSNGIVWIAWSEGYLTDYTNGEPNKRVNKEEEIEIELEGYPLRPGLAIDSEDNVYVRYEPGEKFEEDEEAENGQGKEGQEPCEKAFCFVAKLTTHEVTVKGQVLVPGEPLNRVVDNENASALATDPSNDDAYIGNFASLATFGSNGALIQSFGAGQVTNVSGIAVNPVDEKIYAADAAADRIDVFVPEPPAKPAIEELSAEKITSDSAVLNAQIDPVGAATTYTFQYSTSGPIVCEANPNPACEAPIPGGDLGSSFSDQTASLTLTGLAPGTTYHYRVLAKNTFGTVTSEERTLTTQAVGGAFTLPDGRAWELVSPPQKNGVAFESLSREGGQIQASAEGNAIAYIATGPDEPEPEGNRSPEFTQIFSNRVGNAGAKEWASKDINTPNQFGRGVFEGLPPEYQFFSADLSKAILNPLGTTAQSEPALSEEASEKTVYLRKNEGCAPVPSSCYTPLVTSKPPFSNVTSGEPFGGAKGNGISFIDATPDAKRAVLQSEARLTEAPTAPGNNLYEWLAGEPPSQQLQLINVLPDGTPAQFASLGNFLGNMFRHAISNDGSRVIWSAAGHLYVRDMVAQKTVQVDVPEAGAEVGTGELARFQTASSDGSKVFFTDEQRLTEDATSVPEANNNERRDLYVYDVNTGKLTDLTVDSDPGETADVRGLVIGASDDGSEVAFVANGVLSTAANSEGEKATSGHCVKDVETALPGATCNLYIERYNAAEGKWGAPSFVAALSQADNPVWDAEGGKNEDLARITTRMSPNGRYVAFMSDRRLTGYDNRDANPASGGAPDEEVFLYDADSASLNCVSCNPTGARPMGVQDEEESGEGLGLLVDRIENWSPGEAEQGRWLAANIPGWTATSGTRANHQSRFLNDSGRLFFNATDVLVPQDKNSKNDVYEYEPNGVGSCNSASGCVSLISGGTSNRESAFLDASESGNDVFFLTSSALVPQQDQDNNFDVYDARVCAPETCITPPGGSSAACDSLDSCKGQGPSQPAFGAPDSLTSPASGNGGPQSAVSPTKVVVKKKLTRAQQLAKALKACKKLKKKAKRVSCEKSARKKYGPKKAAKKSGKKAAKSSPKGKR